MGRWLREAKALVQHGEWLPYLEARGIAARTAQRFMQLPERYPEIRQLGAFGSVREALEGPAGETDADFYEWEIAQVERINSMMREIAESDFSLLTLRELVSLQQAAERFQFDMTAYNLRCVRDHYRLMEANVGEASATV